MQIYILKLKFDHIGFQIGAHNCFKVFFNFAWAYDSSSKYFYCQYERKIFYKHFDTNMGSQKGV